MKRCAILCVIVLLVVLGACAKAKKMPVDLIRVAVSAYPESLVPTRLKGDSAKLIQAQVYETLYKQQDSVYRPVLALALPECEKNGIRCVIRIAQGIRFHDGSTFKAQDAVYSINHLIEAKSTTMTASFASAKVIDETSFLISLNYPDGTLLTKLSHPMFAMIKMESDVDAKLEKTPIGTGPYQFVSSENNIVVLTRNDDYHDTKALTKNVEFIVYADVNNALTALRDKDINLAVNVPSGAKDTIAKFNGAQWIPGEVAATVYLGIRNQSMQNGELESLNFRKAVMSAIDRRTLADSVDGTSVNNLFGLGIFGYQGESDNNAFIHGAAIGNYADESIKIVTPEFAADFDVAANIADQLKRAGFTKVSIEKLAPDAYQKRMISNQGFDLMIFVWEYGLADGGAFIDVLFGPDSSNILRYQNLELDSLILTTNRSLDQNLRKTSLNKMENMLIAEGLILPLTKIVRYNVAGEKISNLTLLPDATINLGKITISE